MANQIITGFHAVEERVRRAAENSATQGMSILYSKPGPRIKKILEIAKKAGIPCNVSDDESLDSIVKSLPEVARDHRGIVLTVEGAAPVSENLINFEQWVEAVKKDSVDSKRVTVIVLDSVTDPHNVGAIIRSCDQFGASLVVMPERRGASNVTDNEVIARSSAGSSAWVPTAVVTNLVRSVKLLKDAGFWVYGADAGGESVQKVSFASRSVIVMGSEGSGIARLLGEQCDTIVSIPTCGKIDSLNVSVAAGVLLYETYRQSLVAAE